MKYRLLFSLLVFGPILYAQLDTIAFNGFEIQDQWKPLIFSTPPCSEQEDTWDYVSSLETILPIEGNSFWGIQDLNGHCGGSDFETIEFPEIDVNSYRMVTLSFAINVIGYDNGDDIKYQLRLNGNWSEELFVVDGSNNYSSDGWETFSIDIPNNASNIGFRLLIKQNGSDMAGIDAVCLRGKPLEDCSELMISEYVEGSSSRQHRNNYLELHNPGTVDIDLSNYQLVKYTGSNSEPSSSLDLWGIIRAGSTFVIKDITENLNVISDLETNSQALDFTGDDAIVLTKNGQPLDQLGYIGIDAIFGQNVTLRRKSSIESPNNEFSEDEWDVYPLETVDDLSNHVSTCTGPIPEIQLSGNSIPIKDGSTTISVSDYTYLGEMNVNQNTSINRSFFIHNTGSHPLTIHNGILSGEQALYFDLELTPQLISPGDSLEAKIEFYSYQPGSFETTVEIHSDDASESIYNFRIAAEKNSRRRSPLLITQYYEGTANNRWIEISNVSSVDIPDDRYFLCLYRNEDTDRFYANPPSSSRSIPALKAGQSLLFRASLNVTEPAYALTGQEIPSSVCNFNGDDILILSSSNDSYGWRNRIDRIGRTGNWGTDLSLIRNEHCGSELGNTGYDEANWGILAIDEVNQAVVGHSDRLGIYGAKTVRFNNGIWTPHPPDQNDHALLASNYDTSIYGDLEVCSLTLGQDALLEIQDSDHVVIEYDLEVFGELIVYPEGSLVFTSDLSQITNEGSISIQKRSGQIKPFDYTYWSSPVTDESIDRVFQDSPAGGKYIFESSLFEDYDQDGLDDNGDSWQEANDQLQVGRGYAIMAPHVLGEDGRQFVSFSGTPNNGLLEIFLPDNPFGKFWHLLGNPYPSAIDVEKFLRHPLNEYLLNKTLYFWTHATIPKLDPESQEYRYSPDDYAIYTLGTGGIRAVAGGSIPTGHVSSCQGFFVESVQEGSVVFSNSMRVTGNNELFFKASYKDQPLNDPSIWLNLLSDDGDFSQILLGYRSGASTAFDIEYDGERFSSGKKLNFYSKIEQQKVAIQGLPMEALKDTLILGFDLKKNTEAHLKIEIDSLVGFINQLPVILYDRVDGIKHNLIDGPYFFTSESSVKSNDRFFLAFSSEETLSDAHDDPIKSIAIIPSDRGTLIRAINGKKMESVYVYDLTGRVLYTNFDIDGELMLPTKEYASRSIYLLRVEFDDYSTTTKFIP